MDGELINVNRDIHKGKRVNIVFDILYIVCNSLITLLRIDKILAIGHDLFVRRRGICLFESSLRRTRCGGSKEQKINFIGQYIEYQLVLIRFCQLKVSWAKN